MEHFENISTPDKSLLITNIMQLELAKLHNESIEDFITKYAGQFRNTLINHPEFIQRFEENQDKVLQEIEAIIYH